MALRAYHKESGLRVNIGDTITNFRGEDAILVWLSRAEDEHRDGKIIVGWSEGGGQREYGARVYGLRVIDE